MKQLTCEMCGNTDIVKNEGVFVCQSCGCKYTVEEARKMMVEGTVSVQGTVVIDNTEQINNFIDLAKKAEERNNKSEAESYANKALEIEPNNWKALYLKGKAAGWQSSTRNSRLDEAIDCFTKAIECCEDEEKAEQLKQAVGSDVSELSLAMIGLRCSHFEDFPNSDNAEAIRLEALVSTLRVITLLLTCGVSVDKFKSDAALRMNGAAVKAWRKVWDNYTDGKQIQPTSGFGAIYASADHSMYSHPSKFDFDRFIEGASACAKVVEIAIEFDSDDDEEDITRYDNLLFIAPKIIDAKSVTFVAGGAYSNSKWKTEYTLTEESKTFWRNKISEWESAKAEAKKKVAEKYWADHSSEKTSLEGELASLKQEIVDIPKRDEYKSAQSKITELDKRIEELDKKKSGLGLFSGKEKKAIKANMDDLTRQKVPYVEQLKTMDKSIADKKTRITEIEQKLLHPCGD